jgi:hypothetical protein
LLTLQVRNAPDLVAEAQLNIKVKDENNKSPVFTNIDSGQERQRERKRDYTVSGIQLIVHFRQQCCGSMKFLYGYGSCYYRQ